MQARASASEVNHEAFNSSCRSLALDDLMQAFCCGFPGWMKLRLTPIS
jgi:hypothetical protein